MATEDAIYRESARLKRMGIEFEHIQLADGLPVVTVNTSVMDRIIDSCETGEPVKGRFVCQNSTGHWSASYHDPKGQGYRTDLSECLAYRYVLGYRIGRVKPDTRYKGQCPPMRRRGRPRKGLGTES